MMWSVTKSKMFSKCQRKWYFSEIVANHKSKDPLRREAYLLKQLQSLHAWRGSLVDKVIEKLIIPRAKSGNFPSEEEITNFAMRLMDRQLEFGKARKHRRPNITKSNGDDSYCAFYDLEYNGGLNEEELKEAKQDVTTSLQNLIRSNLLQNILTDGLYVTAQRSLVWEFENMTVSCTPDLIAFFKDAPPLIVDWKVHFFGNTDSWLQLGVYAVALSRIKPHRDFPQGVEFKLKDPTNIRLIEYQLLHNNQREYSISLEDIADIDDYIFMSSTQMKRLVNGEKFEKLDINRFQTARLPETCEKCQFKKLCWKAGPVQTRLLEEWA